MLIHTTLAIALALVLQVPTGGPTQAGQASGPSLVSLGRVTITQAVLANGMRLPPGTYELRLTGESLTPLPGQTPGAERWVELVKDGMVVAREAAIVSEPERTTVGTSGSSSPGRARVETLKGGDFVRVSVMRDGNRYLIHLPVAGR